MEEKKLLLQTYADRYCDGDRYRALHKLLTDPQDGKMDDYVDELNTDEANFVYCCMILYSHRAYGSEKNFKKVLKTNMLAETLEISTEDIQNGAVNPFRKKLLKSCLMLAGTILLTVLSTTVLSELEWFKAIPPVLGGLSAMSVAESLLGTIRFHRLKRRVKKLPQADQTVEHPSFEECMEYYLQRNKNSKPSADIPAITAEEATRLLNVSRKKNLQALFFSLLLIAIFFSVGVAITIGGIVGGTVGKIVAGIIGIGGILAFAFWQVQSVFKAALATRAPAGLDKADPQWQRLNTRQNLGIVALLLLGGLYLILTVAGCAICICMMTV